MAFFLFFKADKRKNFRPTWVGLEDKTPPANAGGIILVQAKLAPYLRALGAQCSVVSLPH